jgi:negative modulator of initiation of replication
MKIIEIEDSVYSALEKKVQSFGEKPNDVIKRLLSDEHGQKANGDGMAPSKRPTAQKSDLLNFIESPEYRRGKAKDRYFNVLRFIYKANPPHFEKLEGYSKGSRVQISKNAVAIRQSGRHTYPQQLDGTPFWIMTNLSNERKQTLLQDIMQFLGYPQQEIDVVVKTIATRYFSQSLNPI